MFVSDKRICLDVNRKVVDCNSPEAATLLIAEGGRMSNAEAEKYGLLAKPKAEKADDAEKSEGVIVKEDEPEKKMVMGAPANKAIANKANK